MILRLWIFSRRFYEALFQRCLPLQLIEICSPTKICLNKTVKNESDICFDVEQGKVLRTFSSIPWSYRQNPTNPFVQLACHWINKYFLPNINCSSHLNSSRENDKNRKWFREFGGIFRCRRHNTKMHDKVSARLLRVSLPYSTNSVGSFAFITDTDRHALKTGVNFNFPTR